MADTPDMDAELAAMKVVADAVGPLAHQQRQTVLRWAWDRLVVSKDLAGRLIDDDAFENGR